MLTNHYDLTLCPARAPYAVGGNAEHLADTRVGLEWDEALFAAIGPPLEGASQRRCRPQRLPPHVVFHWIGDEGLQERTCDLLGNRLTYVMAGDVAALGSLAAESGNQWNIAVFSLLAALPADTPVVLFWR